LLQDLDDIGMGRLVGTSNSEVDDGFAELIQLIYLAELGREVIFTDAF
jgi:hypothetical protein